MEEGLEETRNNVNQLADLFQKQAYIRKCGICGETGHSKGSCPKRPIAQSNFTRSYFTPLKPIVPPDSDGEENDGDGYDEENNMWTGYDPPVKKNSQPETYDQLLSKLSPPIRKMCLSRKAQEEESKESDEWLSSLQYLNAIINDLTISESFLDSASGDEEKEVSSFFSNDAQENKNTKFQSTMQKRSKTEIPPMKLRLLNMDEVTEHESSRNVGHPAMTWTFAMVVTGKSGTGKTNLLANLVLGDKDEYMQKGKKGGSRYIRCDDLIICGYHPDEPKWAYVRYIYNMISKDPRAPYYENISFSYIPPEKIPSTRAFSPKRSTLIIFEDVCLAPEHIQNRIGQFFGNGRHRNISCVYVTQKYHKLDTFTRENTTHLVVFNSGSSHEDISKIIRRYTDDVKNASM
ncbi:hypothetical protein RhiirA1_514387, partial [Rhizophagus irregularis]